MAEDEVLIEVDAMQAVYGDDCIVLDAYPPHLHVHIKPRTADVSSQQFVEAVIGIRAGPQYPKEPPHIHIIEYKGLDEQRQKHLITGIEDKACELSSCLMLVSLCEEAVERLSSMNHPEGNCPLCLYQLVEEDASDNILPFMKLMSCFHCFHCECIIRWWNWLQSQKEIDPTNSAVTSLCAWDMVNQQGMHGTVEEGTGSCPVCRKVFHAKDLEHVLDLVGAHSQLAVLEGICCCLWFSHGTKFWCESKNDRLTCERSCGQLSSSDAKANEDENLLQSDSEKIRRQKIEAILKLQQENSGLIEPKRNEVLLPGMFLPQLIPQPTTTSPKETTEQQQPDPIVAAVPNSTGSSHRPSTSGRRNSSMRIRRFIPESTTMSALESTEQPPTDPIVASVTNSSSSSSKPSASEHRNSGMRKHRGPNSRKQVKQWIKKEIGNAD